MMTWENYFALILYGWSALTIMVIVGFLGAIITGLSDEAYNALRLAAFVVFSPVALLLLAAILYGLVNLISEWHKMLEASRDA